MDDLWNGKKGMVYGFVVDVDVEREKGLLLSSGHIIVVWKIDVCLTCFLIVQSDSLL